jgi:hypothetical protein
MKTGVSKMSLCSIGQIWAGLPASLCASCGFTLGSDRVHFSHVSRAAEIGERTVECGKDDAIALACGGLAIGSSPPIAMARRSAVTMVSRRFGIRRVLPLWQHRRDRCATVELSGCATELCRRLFRRRRKSKRQPCIEAFSPILCAEFEVGFRVQIALHVPDRKQEPDLRADSGNA